MDGTQFHPTIHVSNLVITKFKSEGKRMDAWRAFMIERKAGFLEEGYYAPKKFKQKLEEMQKEEEEI